MTKHWLIVWTIIFASTIANVILCQSHKDGYFFLFAINLVFGIKYMRRVREELRLPEPDHD